MQTTIDFTACVHPVEHHGTQDHLDENRPRFGKQCGQVYEYMKTYGSITQHEAGRMGIRRLASRINDLKKILSSIGMTVESKMIAVGETKVAQYKLKELTTKC